MCALLIATTGFGWFASPAAADTVRTARVDQVKGTVHIMKAGGSKEFRAYKGMSLNLGDHVSTGAHSSLVLTMVDREDEVTIGENTDVYISELSGKNGGTQSGLTMWSGSIWVKAKKLANAEDTFTVKTPTAVMGIRGTQFFTGVDPSTGDTTVSVGAGAVQTDIYDADSSDSEGETILVLPWMQAHIFNSGNDARSFVSPVDLDSLIDQISPEVIEAIIRNKQALDRENEQFIEDQRKRLESGESDAVNELLDVHTPDDLSRVAENLNRLIGNILKKAIEKNVVDEQRIRDLVEEANKTLDKKIDLDNVQPFQLTDLQKQRLEQWKRLEQEKAKRMEEQKKKQQEMEKRNEQIMKKLKELQDKQKQDNAEEMERKKQQIEDNYKKQLEDAAKRQFEERLKNLKDQEKNQNEAGQAHSPTPTPDGSANSGPSSPSPTIVEISDLSETVKVGDSYALPAKVPAHMSNQETAEVPVVWEPAVVDTGEWGVYTFHGTVEGFNDGVTLTLTVLWPIEGLNWFIESEGSNRITVKWNTLADVFGLYYTVTLSDPETGAVIDEVQWLEDSYAQDGYLNTVFENLDYGSAFTIKVEALDGDLKLAESEVSAAIPGLPEITGLSAEASPDGHVVLAWDRYYEEGMESESEYRVYVNGQEEDTVSASVYSSDLYGLMPGINYTFKVEGWSSGSDYPEVMGMLDWTLPTAGPANGPLAISFEDTNEESGTIDGTVILTPASDESDIVRYEVYWANIFMEQIMNSDSHPELAGSAPKTGSDVTFELHGDIPPCAVYLIAYAVDGNDRLSQQYAIHPVIDKRGEELFIPLKNFDLKWGPVPVTASDFLGVVEQIFFNYFPNIFVGIEATSSQPDVLSVEEEGGTMYFVPHQLGHTQITITLHDRYGGAYPIQFDLEVKDLEVID